MECVATSHLSHAPAAAVLLLQLSVAVVVAHQRGHNVRVAPQRRIMNWRRPLLGVGGAEVGVCFGILTIHEKKQPNQFTEGAELVVTRVGPALIPFKTSDDLAIGHDPHALLNMVTDLCVLVLCFAPPPPLVWS